MLRGLRHRGADGRAAGQEENLLRAGVQKVVEDAGAAAGVALEKRHCDVF